MATATKSSEKQINRTIEEEKDKLNQWEQKLDRLEDELKNIEKETQMVYTDQVDAVREKFNRAYVRLQAMAEGDPKEWVEGRSEYQEKFESFKRAFMDTAEQIKKEDNTVALGWLQGLSDERTRDSEGWVEGMGEQGEGSEGWVEGMGKQPTNSKGWVEGYDDAKS